MDLSRYQRQTIFPPVGVDGQEHLINATAVIVGCGATGSALANLLVRAGFGRVRIIDRDFVELNNLQRQILFDEDDIAANLPKAEAAARKLRRINSQIDNRSHRRGRQPRQHSRPARATRPSSSMAQTISRHAFCSTTPV